MRADAGADARMRGCAGLRAHGEGEPGGWEADGVAWKGKGWAQESGSAEEAGCVKVGAAWLVKIRTVAGDEWIVTQLEMGPPPPWGTGGFCRSGTTTSPVPEVLGNSAPMHGLAPFPRSRVQLLLAPSI